MILTTDVAYSGDDTATAAGLLHRSWQTDEVARNIVKRICPVAPYEPGRFYERELPCILALLDDIEHGLEAIVIDGYVTLGAARKPGLGAHLFDATGGSIPVVGAAKTRFAGTPRQCQILRGKSTAPLYVTAAGMPLTQAKACIQAMHGENRIPTLLKRVDLLSRGLSP